MAITKRANRIEAAHLKGPEQIELGAARLRDWPVLGGQQRAPFWPPRHLSSSVGHLFVGPALFLLNNHPIAVSDKKDNFTRLDFSFYVDLISSAAKVGPAANSLGQLQRLACVPLCTDHFGNKLVVEIAVGGANKI